MGMSQQDNVQNIQFRLINDSKKRYDQAVRALLEDPAISASSQKFLSMTEKEHAHAHQLGEKIQTLLAAAFQEGDPTGETAQQTAALHKEWLSLYWDDYSPEAHAAIGQKYVDNPRFTPFSNQAQPGMAEFFRDALKIFTQSQV
jgi:hypothetical protein